MPYDVFVDKYVQERTVDLLGIGLLHLNALAQLPLHHRDPFDRLLAVQCQVEGLPIVSRDDRFDDYGIRRIW